MIKKILDSSFFKRVITSIFLIPVVIWLVYQNNTNIMFFVVGIILFFCAIEWCTLIPIYKTYQKIIFLIILSILFWQYSIIISYFFLPLFLVLICVVVFLISALKTYPKKVNIWGHASIIATLGIFLLFLLGVSLVSLKAVPDLLIYLFLLVWATDIGGYFIGKLYGKHKLIVRVSPGKSIEGLIGGLFLVLIISMISYFYFTPNLISWIIIACSVFILAILGDLLISLLKRRCGLKDTGQILPGHGGILDRLDSLLLTAPFFYFLYIWKYIGLKIA